MYRIEDNLRGMPEALTTLFQIHFSRQAISQQTSMQSVDLHRRSKHKCMPKAYKSHQTWHKWDPSWLSTSCHAPETSVTNRNLRGTVSTVAYESIRKDNLWLIFDWKASLTSHHDLMWACWNDIMIRMKITRKKVPQQQPQHLRWQGRSREGMTPKREALKAQRGEVGVLMVSHQIIHTCWG